MPETRDDPLLSSSSSGYTLVELLVYMMLMVVVLVIVGGFLISSLSAQNSVANATQASTAGQLVSRSVGHGVRDARALWHSPAADDPEILMALTADAAGTPLCQAWSFDGDEVRTTSSTSAITSAVSSWTLLGDGMRIAPGGATSVFDLLAVERRVDLNLEVLVSGSEAILVQTSSASRQPESSTGAPCFP